MRPGNFLLTGDPQTVFVKHSTSGGGAPRHFSKPLKKVMPGLFIKGMQDGRQRFPWMPAANELPTNHQRRIDGVPWKRMSPIHRTARQARANQGQAGKHIKFACTLDCIFLGPAPM
jgi:hypothetical protein